MNIFEDKLKFQKYISDYFGDIIMTKVKQTPQTEYNPSYSLYYAKIGCMLCVEDRYIVAIVEQDPLPIGYQDYLSHIQWISFQTRTLERPSFKLKTQNIKSISCKELNEKIRLIEKKEDRNVYVSDISPIKIELLFSKEDETYSDNGTIQSALDTFNCVLSFTI